MIKRNQHKLSTITNPIQKREKRLVTKYGALIVTKHYTCTCSSGTLLLLHKVMPPTHRELL